MKIQTLIHLLQKICLGPRAHENLRHMGYAVAIMLVFLPSVSHLSCWIVSCNMKKFFLQYRTVVANTYTEQLFTHLHLHLQHNHHCVMSTCMVPTPQSQ